jgi:hypothetical protein
LVTYQKDLEILNDLISADKNELAAKITKIWQASPHSFQVLPLLLAVRDTENFA